MRAKLHYVFSLTMFLFVFSVAAQNSSWRKIESIKNTEKLSKLNLIKNKSLFFELDPNLLQHEIANPSSRNSNTKKTSSIISVPGLNGKLEGFKIYKASVFSPSLAAKYPNIKSYVGISLDNKGTSLRMSVSPQGVQTMVSYMDKPTTFMQPISKGSNQYILYNAKSKGKSTDRFECKTIDELNETFSKSSNKTAKINEGGANDQTLQKFRIAISTTSEYTAYHDDGNNGNGDAIADALAAINVTLSRVNEVFETDMAVTFELVDATQLIYNDAVNDPYSDATVGTEGAWNTELQNTLSDELGATINDANAAYDIGHLFGATGGGGNAGCIGCVCVDDTNSPNDQNKGSAYTSPSNGVPEGDTFDIDFVVHEIGHQMGANHTWAFDTEGTGVNSEPGSGTTIMAYAGIEGANNVELQSDDYFHYHSINQILAKLTTKSCQTSEAITNNPPVANAGNNYNIPAGTAYILKGSATDSDDVNLTYCWEQIDSGVTDYLNFGPDLVSGPMNRSLPPTSSPDRYIPKFSSVLAGNTIQTNPTLGSDWETVSTVGRNLNWALTVRDRAPASATGGQTSFDTMQITVENVTPFTITNPVTWAQGSNATIEWEVGQTNNGTINCQNVNIKLSTDSGLTFPTTIVSNTPNDGSYNYLVPGISDTSTARILIESVGNIFYDVSNFDFSISQNQDFFFVEESLDPISCNEVTATFHFDFVTANGFSENTVFSASGNPIGSTVSFSPTNLSASGSVTMTISNLDGVLQGDYPITLTGTSTSITNNKIIAFPFFSGACTSSGNTDFDTSTTLVQFNTINNSSAKPSGYSNYTALSTDVNRNGSYDLTINVNTAGNYTTATMVWIDWNQDCDFDDVGEDYDLGTATDVTNGATSNSSLSITVPNDAILGNTVMRVSTKWDGEGDPTFCENGADAEVEDYTINVEASLAIEEFGFENFIVFPNPTKGEFTIKLNSSLSSNIKVEIYDLRGRNIYKNTYKKAGDFNENIDLNYVQSGMYILNVSDDKRRSTQKIIIE